MNHLLIGAADKTDKLLELAQPPFLLIDDGPIADAFLEHFPKAKLFDIAQHSFNPLRGIDYKRARDFAQIVYGDKDLMTYRDGKRALTKLLLDKQKTLDQLTVRFEHKGLEDALATIDDLLLSPVLRQVLCGTAYFKFTGSIVVKLDRAKIGDFDAFLLASLLIGQTQGHHVLLPDFGFYGRDFHRQLIRQNRLVAGLNFLAELKDNLKDAVLSIKDKDGAQCVYEDAQTLAIYARHQPNTEGYSSFVQRLMA